MGDENEEKLGSCIDVRDFKVTKHVFLIKNETSQTYILDPEAIALQELHPNGLRLKMPKNSCQKSQNLIVYIFNFPLKIKVNVPFLQKHKDKHFFACLGRIIEFERFDEAGEIGVFVEFTQVDEEHWGALVAEYVEMEKRIEVLNAEGRTK